MKVEVWLKETSQPIHHDAVNTYQKGSFYCVFDGVNVTKYPIDTIFRILESYKKRKHMEYRRICP